MAIGVRETMVRSAGALFALACTAVAAYAFTFLFRGFTAAGPLARQFAISGLDVPAHFFGGGLALLLAPWQMSQRLRRRWPTLHRIGGGLYTGGVLIGGLAGLSLARHAQGGWASGSGFALLALAWLGVTATGIAHAVRGHHEAHRRWMWRSVALTASAVTLRITLGLGLGMLHLPFLTVYVFAAWSCWTINLAICETLLRTRFDPALASAVRVAQ
ncbi:DUF2306 domain-containing protein [Lysobacter sp. LF1]|uniref:DUF2306 domain-containing protein n=1 Tax=Lysobacter stagni TaxID=3045172 RepID=A0ABT6XC81_9GAMM|nr:DUF2306 domain-containing protein [Lysobacter sp. LF1]MDI9237749.1 DUF2306 domain-containing protein [Lysobacter sp. LF1]